MLLFNGKKENYVFASPLAGQLLQHGKPLAGVKITREIFSNTDIEIPTEEFVTNDDGYFTIPAYEQEIEISPLAQFSSSYNIEAHINGTRVLIWYASKLQPERFEETGTEPKSLVCDVENEETPFFTEDQVVANIMSRCTWE